MTTPLSAYFQKSQCMADLFISGENVEVAEEWVTLIRQLSTRELETLNDHLVKEKEKSGLTIQTHYKKLSEEHIDNLRKEQTKKISDLHMRCLLFSKQIEASLSEKKRQKLTVKYLQQKDQLADLQSLALHHNALSSPSKCSCQNLCPSNLQGDPEFDSAKERAFRNLQKDNHLLENALAEQKAKASRLAEKSREAERDRHYFLQNRAAPEQSRVAPDQRRAAPESCDRSRSTQSGKSIKRVRFLT